MDLNKYQKSIFNLLNPFTNISGYLNLWDIFSVVFRQLRMTFFHKIMVMHNTISQRVISKCKNDKR